MSFFNSDDFDKAFGWLSYHPQANMTGIIANLANSKIEPLIRANEIMKEALEIVKVNYIPPNDVVAYYDCGAAAERALKEVEELMK